MKASHSQESKKRVPLSSIDPNSQKISCVKVSFLQEKPNVTEKSVQTDSLGDFAFLVSNLMEIRASAAEFIQSCFRGYLIRRDLAPVKSSTSAIVWKHGGTCVSMLGTFTSKSWSKQIHLTHSPFTGLFWTLHLASKPSGVYSYKFVVDGVWVFDKTAPLVQDKEGNINNCIKICQNSKDQHLNLAVSSTGRLGNADSYFCDNQNQMFGLACGNLEYEITGTSPGDFSNELMALCYTELKYLQELPLETSFALNQAMSGAHKLINTHGSASAMIGMSRGTVLYTLNTGNCRYLVIRKTNQTLTVVSRSSYNGLKCISRQNKGKESIWTIEKIDLKAGDIVCVSSDHFFNHKSEASVLKVCERYVHSGPKSFCSKVAGALVSLAGKKCRKEDFTVFIGILINVNYL